MLLDSQHVFSDGQAITATANSTNVIDLGAAKPGPGNSLRLKAHVTQAFNTLTSLDFVLKTDTDEGMATAIKTHQTVNVALAGLALGKVIDLGEIPDGAQRYARMTYTVNGSNPSTGKLTVFVAPMGGDQTFVGQE